MPQPFISRTLQIDAENSCTLRFFKPIADGDDFRCNFEIDYGRTKRSHRVFGIDAIQSLILAMSVVQAELERGAKPIRRS